MSVPPKQSTTTLNKKLLIVSLLSILCFVFWNNFLRSENRESRITTDVLAVEGKIRKSQLPATRKPTLRDGLKGTEPNVLASLPSVDITKLLSQNPFANPIHRSKMVALDAAKRKLGHQSQDGGTDGSSWELSTANRGRMSTAQSTVGNLTAILMGGERSAALINDEIYFENDPVGKGWRIQTIHSDRVTLVHCEQE